MVRRVTSCLVSHLVLGYTKYSPPRISPCTVRNLFPLFLKHISPPDIPSSWSWFADEQNLRAGGYDASTYDLDETKRHHSRSIAPFPAFFRLAQRSLSLYFLFFSCLCFHRRWNRPAFVFLIALPLFFFPSPSFMFLSFLHLTFKSKQVAHQIESKAKLYSSLFHPAHKNETTPALPIYIYKHA